MLQSWGWKILKKTRQLFLISSVTHKNRLTQQGTWAELQVWHLYLYFRMFVFSPASVLVFLSTVGLSRSQHGGVGASMSTSLSLLWAPALLWYLSQMYGIWELLRESVLLYLWNGDGKRILLHLLWVIHGFKDQRLLLSQYTCLFLSCLHVSALQRCLWSYTHHLSSQAWLADKLMALNWAIGNETGSPSFIYVSLIYTGEILLRPKSLS